MPIKPDGTAVCDRCNTALEGYGVLYGLVTSSLDPGQNVVRRIFCYYHGCRDVALEDLVVFPVNSATEQECVTCLVPVAGIAEGMLCADVDANGDHRSFVLCYVNGHRDNLLTQAYGWEPPLINLVVSATTYWNRPEILEARTVDVSTNWNVFANAGITTITRLVDAVWNTNALTIIVPRTSTSQGAHTVGGPVASLAKPSDAAVGDLLVVTMTVNISGDVTVPAGWTLFASSKTLNSVNHYGYWRWHDAAVAATSSWSWTFAGDTSWGGTMQAFGGVDAATPFDAAATFATYTATSTTTYTAASVTTVTDNALLLSSLGANTSGDVVGATPPAGWTADTLVYTGFTDGKANAMAHLNAVPRGTYGAIWKTTSGRTGNVMLTALRSAAGQVLGNVVASRRGIWNVNSGLTPVTPASRGTTWAVRSQPAVMSMATWTVLTRVTGSRDTTWQSGSSSGITARTAANTDGINSASVILNAPAGVASGDVVVASFTVGGTVTISSVPTGWTLVASSTQSGTNEHMYYRRAGSSEPSTWTWGLSAATSWGGNMNAFAGVHATTVLDVAATTATFTATGTTSYPVSITTATDGAMLVTTVGANTTGTSVGATAPTGFVADTTVNTGFTGGKANAMAHLVKTSHGAGTYTWTTSSGRAGGVVMLALRPA